MPRKKPCLLPTGWRFLAIRVAAMLQRPQTFAPGQPLGLVVLPGGALYFHRQDGTRLGTPGQT
jgi:hypothetical protein